MPRTQSDLHGILIIDKPGYFAQERAVAQLPTSHDVVQRVRRAGGQRRIGHTGTLDPMASGVLVLCLGQATRLVEYYQGHDKRYRAGINLGIETDTYDALGAVIEERTVPPMDRDAVEAALAQFRGPIQQVPPIYSALKQGGESLHRKARRGENVTLVARPVVIHQLTLVDWTPPAHLVLDVHCSAGTYVRSLAHDLGRALGTVAHLYALRREAAGPFTLADAHTLAAVEEAAAHGRLAELLLPVGARLEMPRLHVNAGHARRLGHGQHVTLDAPDQGTPLAVDTLAAAYSAEADLLGIVRCVQPQDQRTGLWKAEKWLAPQ